MTALSDAKKKGKKKSHKKKTSTTTAIESQNVEQKSTLFPKPVKKLSGSDMSDEISSTGNLGLAGSTASVVLTGSTASVVLTGSTTPVGLTGSTASVVITASTAVGSAELAEGSLGLVGPTTLGPVGSTVKVISLKPLGSEIGNQSTVIQSSVNNNLTATTLQSNSKFDSKSSNLTATDEVDDSSDDDDDEIENEEAPAEDNRSDELSFIHDFRQPKDPNDSNVSKYEHEDYENFVTEPVPENRRKKRHIRMPNADSRKKRQV